jgi:hypothetical protein
MNFEVEEKRCRGDRGWSGGRRSRMLEKRNVEVEREEQP